LHPRREHRVAHTQRMIDSAAAFLLWDWSHLRVVCPRIQPSPLPSHLYSLDRSLEMPVSRRLDCSACHRNTKGTLLTRVLFSPRYGQFCELDSHPRTGNGNVDSCPVLTARFPKALSDIFKVARSTGPIINFLGAEGEDSSQSQIQGAGSGKSIWECACEY
jgi:hypothetical protein